MSFGDGDADFTLGAGTIYSLSGDDILQGLPSEESFERAQSQRWLNVDKSDYTAKNYYAGRQAGLQTAYCHRRRFIPTPLFPEAAADEGDQIKERLSTTALLYEGSLEQ